ncbi:tRNA threonylcarbamoyladenosine biosynthesis protein TsaE [Rhodospirillaceae bacterium LM-1]|nr:tRNA threonylcarbamoyladenosine biosynthesis protein TsaE [Rhodospirillaceae bacterium LM-1]
MLVIDLDGESATATLGERLAALAKPGDVLALRGDLGAGKTALARAFVRAYTGRSNEDVPSPTFTLVQMYEGPRGECWHFDLYRLARAEDARELDIEEAFANAVSLIEWPERLEGLLPTRALQVEIGFADHPSCRRARLTGWNERLKDGFNER